MRLLSGLLNRPMQPAEAIAEHSQERVVLFKMDR
jgi:hypothetical protein